jgi:signal transduction histidine kinase
MTVPIGRRLIVFFQFKRVRHLMTLFLLLCLSALVALGWGGLTLVSQLAHQADQETRLGEGMLTRAYQLQLANGHEAIALRNFLISGNPHSLQALRDGQQAFDTVRHGLDTLPKGIVSDVFLHQIDQLATQERAASAEAIALMNRGKRKDALALLVTLDNPVRFRLDARVGTLISRQKARHDALVMSLTHAEMVARRGLMALISVSSLLMIAAWIQLDRRLVKPLGALERAAIKLEAGDYGVRVVPEGAEEFVKVATAFNSMADGVGREIEALKATERYKDQFLGIISHELRTPLNFIMAFASVLGDEPGMNAEPQRHYLARILAGAEHLLELIDDLLDLARARAGHSELFCATTDVTVLVGTAIEGLAASAAAKSVTVHFEPQPTLIANIDALRVAKLLRNLIANAVKFTPAGGQVWVTAFLQSDQLVLEVIDTGIGIAAADLPRLFTPLEQLDMSATRAAGGTGLGLALCRSYVEAHGGTISARSELGRGSSFKVTLPVARDLPTAVAEIQPANTSL